MDINVTTEMVAIEASVQKVLKFMKSHNFIAWYSNLGLGTTVWFDIFNV